MRKTFLYLLALVFSLTPISHQAQSKKNKRNKKNKTEVVQPKATPKKNQGKIKDYDKVIKRFNEFSNAI